MARNKYDVDETLETKFDMKQIKRLFSYVGRYRKKLIMTIILMLFSSAQKGNPFDGGTCSFDNSGNSLYSSHKD